MRNGRVEGLRDTRDDPEDVDDVVVRGPTVLKLLLPPSVEEEDGVDE
jgi:hypothetical protein